jgi:hypothetical protein
MQVHACRLSELAGLACPFDLSTHTAQQPLARHSNKLADISQGSSSVGTTSQCPCHV